MGHDLSHKVCVLSGRRLKTALKGPIGTPLGFCLFARSQKFNLVASWVIAQKSLIGTAKDLYKKTPTYRSGFLSFSG